MIFLAAAVSAAQARKMKGDDISNLIIEGENRLKVEGVMPPLNWDPELYRDFQARLADEQLIGSLRPPSLAEPPLMFASLARTGAGASPWLRQIHREPVLTLKTKPSKGEDRKVEWTFKIRNSHGKTFYEKKKKSVLPRQIVWEGMSDKHKPLHVGFDYSYSLFIVDEAGNPQRFAGKPFKIKAFEYKRGSHHIAHFFPESIFSDRSSMKFSRSGIRYLTEMKDQLRLRYGDKVEINVYDADQRFALARAKAIQRYLTKALKYPEDDVSVAGQKLSEGMGYRYVEIVSK